MWSRRIRCALACAMVAAPWTFVAAQPAGVDSPVVRSDLSASAERAQQLSDTARQALRLFTDWLGPYPASSLTLVNASWQSPPPQSRPGTAPVTVRWIEPARDPAAERRLIATLASHYWHDALSAPPDRRWFAEALVRYLSARAIDTILEGRQYSSSRYFGGFIPYASRALPLSPAGADARGHVLSFDSDIPVFGDSDLRLVTRAVGALFTLDRFIGWPALQQGLMAFRAEAGSRGHDPSALAAILSEQRGSDLGWFFEQPFDPDKQFDYAIESLTREADGPKYRLRANLRRLGDGVFGAPLPVVVSFADGSTLSDRWPAGEATLSLEYITAMAPTDAAVDPDAMLLLDRDRRNNRRRLTIYPITGVSMRATMAWLSWVENLMLTCLALV